MPVTTKALKFGPAKRKRGGEYKICPQCGKEFYLPPSRVARGEKFCSRACLDASEAPEMVKRICPVCAKEFSVPSSIADRYTVCSRACRTAKTKYVNCERCSKLFRAEKGLNRHYCSEECRRPPIVIECKNCGKQIRKEPADTDRRFCSFACYRSFQGENLLEKTVRQCLDNIGVTYIQEAKMGRYSVDFLLTELNIALEADGTYWHQDTKRDARKVKYLESYGWRVCRITDVEIEKTTDLNGLLMERLQSMTSIELATLQPTLF